MSPPGFFALAFLQVGIYYLGPPEKAERPHPICWAPFFFPTTISLSQSGGIFWSIRSLVLFTIITCTNNNLHHSQIHIIFIALSTRFSTYTSDRRQRRRPWRNDWDEKPNCNRRNPDPPVLRIAWPKKRKSRKASRCPTRNAATKCANDWDGGASVVTSFHSFLFLSNGLPDATVHSNNSGLKLHATPHELLFSLLLWFQN